MNKPKYTIMSAMDTLSLAEVVNEMIKLGWECCGGVAILKSDQPEYDGTFYQSMIHANQKAQEEK